jgi:hypothetical protein
VCRDEASIYELKVPVGVACTISFLTELVAEVSTYCKGNLGSSRDVDVPLPRKGVALGVVPNQLDNVLSRDHI